MDNFEVHNIKAPYIVRFMWASSKSKELWEDKIYKARMFLLDDLAKVVVDSGLAKFAPTNNIKIQTIKLTRAFIANHYMSRWTNIEQIMAQNHPSNTNWCGVYGEYDGEVREDRWDLLRDLWQEALAPECCKEAYFNTKLNDPYLELFGYGNSIKKIDYSLNSLLAPIGLFLSPIVACSPDCQHAKDKSKQIEEVIKNHDSEIYETLRTVVEMPISVDSYRSAVVVDTPMFKAIYSSDAFKEKKILKVKPLNTELFNYSNDWVASGSVFPYKGTFSGIF